MSPLGLLKPNITKLGLLIFLFLLTSFFFVLFYHPETVSPVWLWTLVPLYIISSLIYQLIAKHTLLRRIITWVVSAPLVLLAGLSLISQIVPGSPPEDFLITHNFIDLANVKSFSKFRSCHGHQTITQYSDEPVSNMQHYMPILDSVDPGKVAIYAPFDGYILGDAPNTLVDEGVTMIPKSGIPWWPFNQWRISFNHTHVLPEFQDPPIHFVKAGTLVGFVNDLDRYGQRLNGTQVRVGAIAIPPMFKNGNGEPYKKAGSAFNYMTDEVFAKYQDAIPGLTSRGDMIISKEWRQMHPCKFKEGGSDFFNRPPYFDQGRFEDLLVEERDVYTKVGMKEAERMQKTRTCEDPEDISKNPECQNL